MSNIGDVVEYRLRLDDWRTGRIIGIEQYSEYWPHVYIIRMADGGLVRRCDIRNPPESLDTAGEIV